MARVNKYLDVFKAREEASEQRSKWVDLDKISKEKLIEKKPLRLPLYKIVKGTKLAFCVPNNHDLLGYWDRVEDRLYKIRHCMNISGIRRSLALFQPPIDPALLVRARAAGLSLEDILDIISASTTLPPYRFEYLIEKAKQFAQMVQGFGNALLSAMEKKDVEELTLLKSVHEQNILKLTKDIKKKQIQEAEYQYQSVQETLKNVQNRIDYYQGLIDEGLIPWENTQQIARHTASISRTISSVFYASSGILNLLPQLGSPFAMKWGGEELGDSTTAWAEFLNSLARISEDVAASAGLEATFQRREEEWEQQLTLAAQEKKQVNKQLLAAEIRQAMAAKELEVHEKSIEQAEELHNFYKNKFTGLGLYNFLCSKLNRIYRQAYNIAVEMAHLAERAYQFERNDNTFFIASDNWDSNRAGLLSAERLLLQLQQLEQAYIKNNTRKQEITQTFSLAMLSPAELVKLRQSGSCTINIPRIAFELFYPGQYRRLIKSVRVTIPSVVGPYTNVSARLTLMKGKIEKEEQASPEEHLIAKNTSISTSGAVNDAGMFDFNFRDERYLPFEGGGAISEWKLELPSLIRAFNYDTISDVLLTISYTALEGENREAAETAVSNLITSYATGSGLYRLISLAHEFPNAFHQLLNPPTGNPQSVEFEIEDSHFPYFIKDKNLAITETRLYLKPGSGKSISAPAALQVNTNTVTWSSGDDISNTANSGDVNKIKTGTVNISGSPIKKWKIDAGVNGFLKENLGDIFILIKYKI